MASDFGKVFRDPLDLGDNRKMPTPCKEVLLSNLQLFLDKWSSWQCDEVKLLNSERLATISNIRGHIQKGCLSEIPAGFSTSVNERLHKEMKKLLCKNRMGTQLAYAKFSRFFFKHNQNRAAYDSVISLSAKAHKEAFHGARNDIKQLSVSFGIRKKDREVAGIPQLVADQQCKTQFTLDELTPLVLDDISKVIQKAKDPHEESHVSRLLQDHMYSINTWNTRPCVHVLLYSLSIFRIILLMKDLWSSKEENVMKIPFLFQNSLNATNARPTSSPTNMTSNHKISNSIANNISRESLNNIANSFGFRILPVTGDGNCFFRAVAFQLLQILGLPSCHDNIVNHINALVISGETCAEELSILLRHLTVNEIQRNSEQYHVFFEDIDILSECERFRNSGEFAGQLGDTIPLAMMNVLQIPIVVLTAVHNMPFLSLAPRVNVDHDVVIYLSYIQEGPGHYDALVTSENSAETTTNTLQELSDLAKGI